MTDNTNTTTIYNGSTLRDLIEYLEESYTYNESNRNQKFMNAIDLYTGQLLPFCRFLYNKDVINVSITYNADVFKHKRVRVRATYVDDNDKQRNKYFTTSTIKDMGTAFFPEFSLDEDSEKVMNAVNKTIKRVRDKYL